MTRIQLLACCQFLAILCLPMPCLAQHDVLTQRYDGDRTGATTVETVLNHGNVNKDHFGKLFEAPVDGLVNAQPLYVHDVQVRGGARRNLIFVVTSFNEVFAIDTDASATDWHRYAWSRNLGALLFFPPRTFMPGILGTPVIDASTGTLYVVAAHIRGDTWGMQLHALDIGTGQEKFGAPVWIDGSVPGTGPDSDNGVMTFKADQHQQRPGLALAKGTIYIGFGARIEPANNPKVLWHGWMFAYDAATLKQVGILCTTPDGRCDPGESVLRGDSSGGSFWLSGMAPAVDSSGDIYAETGNGYFDAATGGRCFGNSVVRLHLDKSGLSVADYFAPHDEKALSDVDKELGSTSPILVPDSSLLIGGGKGGNIYVLDRQNLGHQTATDSQAVQEWDTKGGVFAGTCYWNNIVYTWTGADPLTAYTFRNGKFDRSVTSVSTIDDKFPWKGPADPYEAISLSANGTDSQSAILWATALTQPKGAPDSDSVTLYALDATDISKILWTSDDNRKRDEMSGFIMHWVPPIVADGQVYTVAQSDQYGSTVYAYGLLPSTK